MPKTTAQIFNEENYWQPEKGNNNRYNPTARRDGPGGQIINAKKTLRQTGVGMNITGRAITAAGQGVHVAGRHLMAKGVALSGTGLGAVAGVPLALAGGAMAVGGKAIAVAGRSTRNAGRALAQSNRTRVGVRGLPQAVSTIVDMSDRMKVAQVLVPLGGLWLAVQLPLAVFGLVSMGMTGFVSTIGQDTGGNWFTNLIGLLAGTLLSVLKTLGADFGAVFNGLFILSYIFMLALGLIVISGIVLYLTMSKIKPLSGEHAGLKQSMLLLTIISYSLPGLSLFPVIYLWLLVILRYPK